MLSITGWFIGRMIAAEVEKHFEVKVAPTTIAMKASRAQSVTNVTPEENHNKTNSCAKLEKLEKTHGGAKDGAGKDIKIGISENRSRLKVEP